MIDNSCKDLNQVNNAHHIVFPICPLTSVVESSEYEGQVGRTSMNKEKRTDVELGLYQAPSPPLVDTTSNPSLTRTTQINLFTEIIELAQQINVLLDRDDRKEYLMHGITIETLDVWISEASTILGLNVVYDDALILSLGLKDFKKSDCQPFDKALAQHGGIDEILSKMKTKQCLKGQTAQQLRHTLKDTSTMHKTIDILQNGTRRCMVDGFVPNGGREISTGSSYLLKRSICNHAVRKLYDKGQVAIFSLKALQDHDVLKHLHISPLVWTENALKVLGRTCLHASKGSVHFKSYNAMIDHVRSEINYPIPFLPLLPDIADLACEQQQAFPGEVLSGATIDVTAAYNQCALTVDAAKMTATKINVPNGAGGWIVFIVIYLVGIFGCATAGNVYCVCAKAIDELHNPKGARRRSHTYSDDGILIDTQDRIESSVEAYISNVVALFGEDDTINRSKVNTWKGELIGIGWHFDFTTWTVQPKERGMAKLLIAVFVDIPMGALTVSEKDLEKVAGILTWYASGIPAGAKFVSSLHANKHHLCSKSKRVSLTPESCNDLNWWRALLIVAFANPRKIAASISSVRRTLVPTVYLVTDASKLVGGGAQVSKVRGGLELDEFKTRPIRWTRQEIQIFTDMNVSINVLEYFIVIYHIMLHGDLYEGQVVHVECDNTSAIAWIMKNKTKNKTAADSLARIFSLFCLTYRITIICIHIRGVDNIIADFRSRDLSLAAQGADEEDLDLPLSEIPGQEEIGQTSNRCPRAKACRELLRICLGNQGQMHGQQVLKALTGLRGTHGFRQTNI